MDAEQILVQKFFTIKKMGWIPTKRHGDQCLGNAFEDLVGKKEDNKAEADFMGIELKSHRIITSSLMSLFSKSPSSPKGVNTYLRETYGVIEPESGKKVLNTTVSGHHFNSHRGGHNFKIDVDRENEKLWLIVKDSSTGEIFESKNVGNNVYWDFQVVQNALIKKLNKIAILYGEEKDENGTHYVRYEKMLILEGLTLEKMLKAIEDGELMVDIRIGVYASGKNIGKTHDHGTGFRIHLDKLLTYGTTKLYE
jgi:hypothetical protein